MARRRPEPPLDPFERAARRVDPEFAALAEAAEPPRSLRASRLLLYFGILVVAVAAVKGSGIGGAPALERSCTKPGFAVGGTTFAHGAPLEWTAAGPDTDEVVLALDSPTAPGTSVLAGPTPLAGCLVHGTFPLDAATGKHTVTAFLLTKDGTTRKITTRTITVR
ncbi:MAG: hypothetical protein JWP14_1996 [Frankiales bacterium]|nr:hypothetical protein [Frankiales bacterium]